MQRRNESMAESLSKELRGKRGAAQRTSDGGQGGVCVCTYINVCVCELYRQKLGLSATGGGVYQKGLLDRKGERRGLGSRCSTPSLQP